MPPFTVGLKHLSEINEVRPCAGRYHPHKLLGATDMRGPSPGPYPRPRGKWVKTGGAIAGKLADPPTPAAAAQLLPGRRLAAASQEPPCLPTCHAACPLLARSCVQHKDAAGWEQLGGLTGVAAALQTSLHDGINPTATDGSDLEGRR